MPHTNLKVGKDIAAFPPILNARPEGMPFEAYKILQKEQTKRLKRRLKSGFYVKQDPNNPLSNKK